MEEALNSLTIDTWSMAFSKRPKMKAMTDKKPVKKWRFRIHKMELTIRGRRLFTKERLFNMDMALKFGLMIPNTRVNGNMDNNQAKDSKFGMQLILLTLAVGKTGLSMVQVSKLGMMGLISMGIGFMM